MENSQLPPDQGSSPLKDALDSMRYAVLVMGLASGKTHAMRAAYAKACADAKRKGIEPPALIHQESTNEVVTSFDIEEDKDDGVPCRRCGVMYYTGRCENLDCPGLKTV